MKNLEALDQESIDLFTRSLGVLAKTERETKVQNQAVEVMSSNLTSLKNAFGMMRVYSENILALQKAIVSTEKQSSRETTLENYYQDQPADALSSSVLNRFPAIIKATKTLVAKMENLDLASKKSVIESATSGISGLVAGAAALAVGGAAYAGYKMLGDEEEDDEEQDYQPTEKADDISSSKDTSKSKIIYHKSEAPDYEKAVSDKLKQNSNITNPFLTSIFIAQKMRDMVEGASPTANESPDRWSIFRDFGQGTAEGFQDIKPAGGNEAVAKAMAFFQTQGWSKEQAAGIVGNLQVESGNFAPDVISGQRRGDNGKAVGVAQWHPDRQAIFRKVFNRPLPGSSLEQQLQFIQYELNNNEKRAGDRLRQTNDPVEAAKVVDRFYERSSGHALRQRQANARALAGGQNIPYRTGRGVGGAAGDAVNVIKQTLDRADDNQLKVPSNMMKYMRKKDSSVNFNGMHPTVMRRFAAMAMEYNQKTGDTIQVNSAFRTYGEQAALFAKYGPGRAARPGHSRHESGLAIDIQSVQANRLSQLGLMDKYRFHRPVRGEAWHLEPIEGRNVPRSSAIEENMGSDSRVASATQEASRSAQQTAVARLSEVTATRRQGGRNQPSQWQPGTGPVPYRTPRPNISNPGRGGSRSKLPSQASADWYKKYFTQ